MKNEFLPSALNEIKGKQEGLAHVVIKVRQHLPVCLAGYCVFHVGDSGVNHTVPVVLNVIPTEKQTVLGMSVQPNHDRYARVYLTGFGGDYLNSLLVMVETWMARGTDRWFIKPSSWADIPEKRQSKILSDVMDVNHNICEHYPFSILDSVRRSALDQLDVKEFPDTEIERERAKLADRNDESR